MIKRPELLSPAGDRERFDAALRFGADAVYLGSTAFSMRAAPKNFGFEDLRKAVQTAHEKGVKVYLTWQHPAAQPRNGRIARILRAV